jgi:hypothetical protein
MVSARSTPLLASLALGAVTPLAGCGHPASDAECREILTRIVDVELRAQNVSDPAEMTRRRNEAIGGMSDGGAAASSPLEGCVGKRITDKAMQCVRGAQTPDEITEQCLR